MDENNMTAMNDPSTMISDNNIIHNNDNINMLNKSRPFVCQICTRAFIRQEHLKRHMRSHTNEKPFLCIFCGRCFARRDLVLRHQQKLHDTLIGTSQHHELLSQFHNDENILEKIEATKHVIKIEGNKQPILPTPTNPMAKTASQLKKAAKLAERQAKKLDKLQKRQAKLINKTTNHNMSAAGKLRVTTAIDTNKIMEVSPISQQSSTSEDTTSTMIATKLNKTIPSQRRQRHASFSAASAFTYKQQNERPTAKQLQDDLDLMTGIPHQVGFSTPQMSATDLVDKAHENGIENIPFLTLDTINDGKSTTNFKELFFHHDKNSKTHKNEESLIYSPRSKHQPQQSQHPVKHSHDENLAAFDSVPFLADFLTMSSSAGGVGGFLNNPDTNNIVHGNNNINDTNSHDPNFEANAITNLDYFQYDDNLLNLSRINTNSSATSSLSSRDNSRRASNVTPVITVPNNVHQHHQQHDDQYLNRNNHGLYYNAHNSHSLNVVNEGEVVHNTHGTQPHLNRAQSDPERVLSKFITHAPFETDFLNHVDTQHFNDIGFANIHDPSYPYQNNEFTESLSRHPSNAPTSLSQQSPYSVHQNSYAHSTASTGGHKNPSQDLSNTLLSRNPSNHVYENQFPNQNSTNNIILNQRNSPSDSNRHIGQVTRSVSMNQTNGSMHSSHTGNLATPERPAPQINTAPVVVDQAHNNNSTLVEDSGDAHLTINFSPSYPAHHKTPSTRSQTQTPLPPPSQIPSRSQSRTASVPMAHTPVNHSKHQHNKPSHNDQYDLMNLFQSRQMDIYNKHLEISNFAKVLSTDNLQASFHQNMAHTEKLVNDINFDNSKYRVVFFTDQYCDEIIRVNGLKPDQFPTTEELNKYVNLYQDEFHKFFPFIHLHSIIPTIENHPFILSIAMIGALYSFHSIHSVLLSNISWFQIKELLERQHNNYSITPLWAVQSIVLLTFIGIFSNDINVTKSMKIQLATLVELVRLTKLNQPLEHIVNPPIESDHSLLYMDDPRALQQLKERYHSKVQFEKDFHYFIKAQTRIRTCHVILIISNFFTSLTGVECIFHSIDLKCGLPCYKEILYHSPNSQVWSDNLQKFNIELDSKFSLIELSNGNGTYDNCLMYLSSGAEFYSLNSKISFKTLLSLLFSIHEKISIERSASLATPNGKLQHQLSKNDIFLRWKINSIPVISSMLKHWEILFLKNGGIFKPNHDNIETINAYPSLRLIIPLYHFVKVRENVQIAPMMRKIWKQDWNAMNHQMSKFYFDWETLREACTHGLQILEFWIDTVTILEFDPKRITITTPVFSISCMVSSVLILSEYLRVMELTLQNNKKGNPNNAVASHLQISDKVLWIKIYHLLDRIEVHLKQKGVRLSGKARSSIVDIDKLSMGEIRDMIRTSGLSQGMLHTGVDMLSACPVWSVGILFAQALQSRSLALEQM